MSLLIAGSLFCCFVAGTLWAPPVKHSDPQQGEASLQTRLVHDFKKYTQARKEVEAGKRTIASLAKKLSPSQTGLSLQAQLVRRFHSAVGEERRAAQNDLLAYAKAGKKAEDGTHAIIRLTPILRAHLAESSLNVCHSPTHHPLPNPAHEAPFRERPDDDVAWVLEHLISDIPSTAPPLGPPSLPTLTGDDVAIIWKDLPLNHTSADLDTLMEAELNRVGSGQCAVHIPSVASLVRMANALCIGDNLTAGQITLTKTSGPPVAPGAPHSPKIHQT